VPIFGYLAVTAPTLLSALLLISAYLEPNRPNVMAAVFGINSAQAEIKSSVNLSANEIAIYEKLRALPINR
jgi:hypothetical protein